MSVGAAIETWARPSIRCAAQARRTAILVEGGCDVVGMGSHTASGLGRRSELSLGVSRLLIASVACRSGSTSFVRDRPPATLERTLVENWFRRAEAEMAQMIMRRVAHLTIA